MKSFYEHLYESYNYPKGTYEVCEYSRLISKEEFKAACDKYGGLGNISEAIIKKINEIISCKDCLFKSKNCKPIIMR
jgi:hypothetical protein